MVSMNLHRIKHSALSIRYSYKGCSSDNSKIFHKIYLYMLCKTVKGPLKVLEYITFEFNNIQG